MSSTPPACRNALHRARSINSWFFGWAVRELVKTAHAKSTRWGPFDCESQKCLFAVASRSDSRSISSTGNRTPTTRTATSTLATLATDLPRGHWCFCLVQTVDVLQTSLPFLNNTTNNKNSNKMTSLHGSYYFAEINFHDFSMTSPDQINAFPWLLLYMQCPKKNQKVGAQIYTEGERSGQGYFPPSGGRVWGGGTFQKWHILVAFFRHRQDFPSVLFIFAAQNFFSENKCLKFHDFSMTLCIFHDFLWLAKIP